MPITLRYFPHSNKRRWSEKHCSRITIASISLIFLNEIYNLVSPKCYNSGYQEQTLIATHIRSSISECKRHGTQDEAAGRHLRRNVGVSKCWAPIPYRNVFCWHFLSQCQLSNEGRMRAEFLQEHSMEREPSSCQDKNHEWNNWN